jgi:hypothetical protein
VASKIGFYQVIGDNLGFLLAAACTGEDAGNHHLEGVGICFHRMGSRGLGN